MGDGDDLRPRRQELLEFVDQEGAVVGDRRPFDDGALPLAEEIPRHDVGVVLHDREDDLVALAEVHAVGGRDEVDRLGGVPGEDDLVGMRGIEEAAHDLARLLVFLGRGIGQEVQPAMDVGVFVGIGVGRPRRSPPAASAPRRRCRDRRAACHRPSATGSESRGGSPRHRRARSMVAGAFMPRLPAAPARPTRRPSAASAIASSPIASMASSRKASTSSRSASARGMPRAIR